MSAAILDQCAPASVVGVEPSEGFLQAAKRNLGKRATLHQGSAAAIPLGDGSVDVAVSGLVLNFVPDPHAALVEMARVCAGGGVIAAYVWDYAGRMELMRLFWDAAVALDERGDLPPPPPVKREPWPMPKVLAQALKTHPAAAAGFAALKPTYQREYLVWVGTAKQPETIAKRLEQTLRALAAGKKWAQRRDA